jgi:hypothetical protein
MQSWSEHADQRLAEAGFRRGGARAAVIARLTSDEVKRVRGNQP